MSLAILENLVAGSYQWTCPAGVKRVLAFGQGGGGGGGGGLTGISSTTRQCGGGGAGGAACEGSMWIDVTPGVTYDITVGPGGSGGAITGGSPNPGADGNDTTFAIHGGATLATFTGAGGGKAGIDSAIAFGGQSVRTLSSLGLNGLGAVLPGMGGWGVAKNTAPSTALGGTLNVTGKQPGNIAVNEGVGGGNGADSGSYHGGGGGGGGGFPTQGNNSSTAQAGTGGTGGAASSGGVGSNGVSGTNGTRGGGGGGGGGGGCGLGGGGLGGGGGDGGGGYFTLIWA